MQTTRWVDKKTTSLSDAIELLISGHENDPIGDTTACINWVVTKAFDDIKSIALNGRDITFMLIEFSYDQVSIGDQPIEDRIISKDGFIVAYYNGTSVNYIINKNSGAMTLLRKLLKYGGKNEIAHNNFPLRDDMFLWLLSKVYNRDHAITPGNEALHNVMIEAIKGIKGDTEDLLTKVSADGETVINIISTLSFLLESRKINTVKMDVAYGGHRNIELSLSNKSILYIAPENYVGELSRLEDEELLLSQLLLVIYIEILPIIIQAYSSDKDDNVWSDGTSFLSRVADDLTEKIEQRKEDLRRGNILMPV